MFARLREGPVPKIRDKSISEWRSRMGHVIILWCPDPRLCERGEDAKGKLASTYYSLKILGDDYIDPHSTNI